MRLVLCAHVLSFVCLLYIFYGSFLVSFEFIQQYHKCECAKHAATFPCIVGRAAFQTWMREALMRVSIICSLYVHI